MELTDTIEGMSSLDYEDRFVAEYNQLDIRMRKLEDMIVRCEAGTLDFEPKCPLDLLREQLEAMRAYAHVLKVRAEHEGIYL